MKNGKRIKNNLLKLAIIMMQEIFSTKHVKWGSKWDLCNRVIINIVSKIKGLFSVNMTPTKIKTQNFFSKQNNSGEWNQIKFLLDS
jgi:hypothetical protein